MMKNAVSFLVEKTSQNVKTAVARKRSQALLYVVMGVAAFMLVLFLCFALFFSLTVYFSPLQASWMVVALWLLVFSVTWGAIRYIAQKQKETAILPVMPKEQKQLMASSALSALLWVGRRSPVLKYAASFAGIASLFQFIKGVNKHGHKQPSRTTRFH